MRLPGKASICYTHAVHSSGNYIQECMPLLLLQMQQTAYNCYCSGRVYVVFQHSGAQHSPALAEEPHALRLLLHELRCQLVQVQLTCLFGGSCHLGCHRAQDCLHLLQVLRHSR